jgi:general stress protein 26
MQERGGTYESNRAESVRKLGELIKGIRIAMLVTRSGDGSLRARPMAAQQTTFDGTVWFFTAQHSNKVDELVRNPDVGLVYTDASGHSHVSLSGRAALVRDSAKARELWSPLYREWFPKGLEDPELALLRIDVTRAEYWDSPGMLGMVGKLFAGFTGEINEAEEQTEAMHGTVRL